MLRNSSCEGWVIHRRGQPSHEFRYRVWMLLVDTAQPGPQRNVGLPATSIRSTDYLNVDGDVLLGANERLSADNLPPCDRVLVLTQPRSGGLFFNPVNFYLCYADDSLHCILAEINNTPWDEKHTYVLDARGQHQDDELRFSFPKAFHVSPFMPMDIDYHWRVRLKSDSIQIAMRLLKDGDEIFFAGLYLQAQELNERTLAHGRYRYAWQNVRTLARIYWQAARLFVKRSPFYKHPELSTEATST